MITEIKENLNTVKSKWALACKEVYPYFKTDAENEDAIKLLLLYIARDERFETAMPDRNYSLGKGLLLNGRPGTGKTVLLRIVQRTLYYLRSDIQFKRLNMREICQDYQASGPAILMPEQKHWFVDEFGLTTREQVQSYGNKIIVGDELVGIRYDLFQRGYMLHLTTNLTEQQMIDFYNERTVSRLHEMCNFIPLDGNDRRPAAKPIPVTRLEKKHVDRKKIYHEWWQMILRQFKVYKESTNLDIKGPLQQFRIFEDAGLLIMDAKAKEKFVTAAKKQIKDTKPPINRPEAIALKLMKLAIDDDRLNEAQDSQVKALAAKLALQNFYDGKTETEFNKLIQQIIRE